METILYIKFVCCEKLSSWTIKIIHWVTFGLRLYKNDQILPNQSGNELTTQTKLSLHSNKLVSTGTVFCCPRKHKKKRTIVPRDPKMEVFEELLNLIMLLILAHSIPIQAEIIWETLQAIIQSTNTEFTLTQPNQISTRLKFNQSNAFNLLD